MLTEDYLIKMINIAIAALLKIVGLKEAGSYDEAALLIDMTFEQLLGLRASMVKNLDDDRLYYLLTKHDRLDTQRLAIIADLFMQEGDIYADQNRLQESHEDYTRALRYDMEVLFNEPDQNQTELIAKIEYLIQKLDIQSLGADTLWPLAGYYEETGSFAKAESVLLILVGHPEIQEQIQPELIAFYERLLEKSPEALAAGGVSPSQIRERLAQYNQ